MSAEKRSVHTDALATLGTIIDETAGRDAIHLAVEPVVAAVKLFPGQDITLQEDGRATNTSPDGRRMLGIVDPFLTTPVQPGQMFWLVVYPRQITSLRHVWEHPAFGGAAPAKPSMSRSEEWMRAWALMHMSADYYGDGDRLSADDAYANAMRAGEENYLGPYEMARDHIDGEWWGHWEAITGKVGDRDAYFRCSC